MCSTSAGGNVCSSPKSTPISFIIRVPSSCSPEQECQWDIQPLAPGALGMLGSRENAGDPVLSLGIPQSPHSIVHAGLIGSILRIEGFGPLTEEDPSRAGPCSGPGKKATNKPGA